VEGERISALRLKVGRPSASNDDEDEAPLPRPTARIRDPRDATRRISTEELERRAGDLATRLQGLESHLDGLGLRGRKERLLQRSNEPEFWSDPVQARAVLAEIAALEKAIDAPLALHRRLDDLNEQLERASKQGARDPGLLVRAAERWDELARDVEFSDYAARCTEPLDRGDAFVFVRRVGERLSESDVVARLAEMYLRWAAKKGLGGSAVLERLAPDERVSEVALRIEGVCAYGLLRGEEGLHQWIDRRGLDRTNTRARDVDFARVEVLPPAPFELRDDELKVELRPLKRRDGKLLKRHRVHVVLTHDGTMLSVEGGSEAKGPELVPEVKAVLAARVAAARAAAAETGEPDPSEEGRALPEQRAGVVRRYVVSTQPLARDLASGLKAPLESVLEGNLDDFIAPRLVGAG
jgi:peptide chain release factor 2